MSTPAVAALSGALPPEAVREPETPGVWAVGGAEPEAVVEPASVEEVAVVLESAAAGGFGVVAAGGRTDPGATAPRGRFVVLSTRRLAGVEDYQPADLTVSARAGTTLGELTATLAERGQWLPADPPFARRKTVGGLVASGSAGFLGMAYGTPRDHVLGLTVVTGDGRVLRLGGRVMKNVAGFDLVKLMVGSRGTLGIVTSATLRLFPRPSEDRVLVMEADAPGALLKAARRVSTAKAVPASAVLASPADGGRGAALLVRVQGAAAVVDADARTLLGPGRDGARTLRGDEARRVMEGAAERAAGAPVSLRAFALPGLLAEALSAVQDAMPVEALAADVMSGAVAVGTGVQVEAGSLKKLRARLEALGGSLTVRRCPPELAASFPSCGSPGRTRSLEGALRGRFDPKGVLSSGRFGT